MRQYDDKDYKLGDRNSITAKGAIRWLPSDTFTVDIGFDYTTSEENPAPYHTTSVTGILGGDIGPAGGLGAGHNASIGGDCLTTDLGRQTNPVCYGSVWHAPNPFTSDAVFFDPAGNVIKAENETDIFGINMTLEWELGAGTLKSISAYRDVDASFNNDAEGTPFLIAQNANNTYTNESFSQELQFIGSAFSGKLDYVTGLYYFEEDGVQNVLLQLFGFGAISFPENTGSIFSDDYRSIDNSSKAAYAQGTWHFNDRAHLTVGLRYTKDNKDVNFSLNRDPFLFAGPRSQNFDGVYEETVTDPLVTFGYNVNDNTFAYITYTEGFRDGGFPGRFLGSPTAASSYDPEFVTSIEGGLKFTSADNKFRANIAIFSTDYSDFQIAANSADPDLQTTTIDNLADVSLYGAELEAYWEATDNLRFDLAVGYLHNEIDSIVGGELFSLGIRITTDNKIPYAPEWNSNLGVTHKLSFSNGGSLLTRLDWRFVDEQYFRIENTDTLLGDSYNTINFSTTYRLPEDAWDLVFGARNLTDEVYSTSAGVVGASTSVIGNISRPRTLYAAVRYYMGK